MGPFQYNATVIAIVISRGRFRQTKKMHNVQNIQMLHKIQTNFSENAMSWGNDEMFEGKKYDFWLNFFHGFKMGFARATIFYCQ